MAEYQPGACNIGATQQRARRLSGIGSFGIAVGIVVAVVLSVLPESALVATAPFVFGGWVGLIQDYAGFCVAFGALARYDLSGSGGSTGAVSDREAVRADRKQAVKILAVAAVLTAVTTGALLIGL